MSIEEKDDKVMRKPSAMSENTEQRETAAARAASRSIGAASLWLNLCVLWAALAVFSTAYSVAIIGSTLGQSTFAELFYANKTPEKLNQLISAAVGGGQAAGFVGQFFASYFSDRLGRKYTIGIWCCILILGAALSGGCANGSWRSLALALAGASDARPVRSLCRGLRRLKFLLFITLLLDAVLQWPLAALALTYQNEIAIAELRGWLVGTVGLAFGVGYTVSGWFSVAFFYWDSRYAWRLPLILGIIFPLLTLACLPFVPETPRWLCLHDRHEEAYAVVERMHKSAEDPTHVYARNEFAEIKAQTAYDRTLDASWVGIWKRPSYRRRAILISLVAAIGQNTGIQVITSYGPTLYATVGFSPANSLLIAGGWISIAAVEPIAVMWAMDRFGRRPLLIAAPALCCISITIIGVLTKYYGAPSADGSVSSGQAALISMFYIHIIFYLLCEATVYVYYGEVFPNHIRAKGACLGLAFTQLTAVWETWATPYALTNIGYKYWFVYTAINAVGAAYCVWAVKETRNVPLEEIAELFGEHEDVQMHLAPASANQHEKHY